MYAELRWRFMFLVLYLVAFEFQTSTAGDGTIDILLLSSHTKARRSVNLAVAAANEKYKGFGENMTLTWTYTRSLCVGPTTLASFVDMYYKKDIAVVIGPSCSVPAIQVALLAGHWNIPVLGYKAQAGELSNNDLYPTYNHANPSVGQSSISTLREILDHFGWHHLMILYFNRELDVVQSNIRLMFNQLSDRNYTVYLQSITTVQSAETEKLWTWMSTHVRVIVIMFSQEGRRSPVMRFIIDAAKHGYFEGSCKFVFILINGIAGFDSFDESHFEGEMIETALQCSLVINTRKIASDIDYQATAYDLYIMDGVSMYSAALQTAFRRGVDHYDGKRISKIIRENQIDGYSGKVHLDEHGDRFANLYVYDFHMDTRTFGKAGYFDSFEEKLTIEKSLHWWNNEKEPPPDEPHCGFKNEKCTEPPNIQQRDDVAITTSASAISIGILIMVVMGLYYRSWKVKSGVLKMTWKIDSSKVKQIEDSRPTSGTSNEVDGGTIEALCNASICKYESSMVYLKKMELESEINIDYKLKVSLHQMECLSDDNVAVFLGACIGDQTVVLVWKYYSKGPLRDILFKESLNLDEPFKLSFTTDIVRGMAYIHRSQIGVHGNLKATNCIVDSKWAVKVSDFGLPELRADDISGENDEQVMSKLMWTAPELFIPGSREASQQADVYSFGLILHEIYGRKEPWHPMTKAEVIEMLSDSSTASNRPEMPAGIDESIQQIILQCWRADQYNRPTFTQVEGMIRSTTKGQGTSIVDHVIKLMEEYANNLENLVDQRTEQLSKEQQKTDQLLYRLIPQSVADQLKHGLTVPAEYYEKSSVYFSDIVQFTRLAAESTPLQVVQLLNALFSMFDESIKSFNIYKGATH